MHPPQAVKDPLIDCGDGAGDLAIIDLKDDLLPASSKATRFSIRRGGSRRVAVRLGALRGRVKRRTVAQLVARERGKIGPKTTTRRVVLRK